MPKENIRNLVRGATVSAISNWEGPVHKAYGMISPKTKTQMTETMTAQADGISASRKMGRASIAHAFPSNNVTSK